MSRTEPDQAQRDQKAEEAKRERQAEIDELLWLMSDKRGRRWMWRRLEELGVFRISYVPGGLEGDRQTAFNEGRRNAGLALLASITANCPDRYNEMQKEAKANDRRNSK